MMSVWNIYFCTRHSILLTAMLDGKEISATARQFLQNWKASKDAQKKRRSDMLLDGSGDHLVPYDGMCVLTNYHRSSFPQLKLLSLTVSYYAASC